MRKWLKELDTEDRRIIGRDIQTVEFGWPISMPTCRPLGEGLFEVRSSITHKRIARVLFCIHRRNMMLLHGFVKKTQTTPDTDINTAPVRKREIEQ